MKQELWNFLAGAPREVLAEDWSLAVLPKGDLWEARREAEAMAKGGIEHAVCANACLLARSMLKGGKQYFANGTEVLLTLTHKEIEQLAKRWAEFNRRQNPAPESAAERVETLKKALEQAPPLRLRWRVLREFSVLPSEKRAREMTDRDYLYCALNLLLDDEAELDALCPACRMEAEEARCPACGTPTGGEAVGENANFDGGRYERLKRGEKP